MTSSDLSSRASPLVVDAAAPSAVARPGLSAWLVPGIFFLLPLAWVAAYLVPPLNHDVAVILAVSDRWLSGERLYVDVIDVNPPLIFMLNLIPVGLARLLPFDETSVLVLCVVALVVWSMMVCWRTLPQLIGARARAERLLFLPLILFLLIVYPGEMFAQREHLMMIAAIPYALLAAVRCQDAAIPRGRLLSVAIIAGLGFALKPHFLVIPLLIEGYLLVARGWRRALADPMPWLTVGVMALYAVAAWLITPEYFTSVLPLVMESYEEIGGTSPLDVLFGRLLAPFLLLLIPLTVVAFVQKLSPLTKIIGLTALGAAASGVLQAKGWPYHVLPAQMATILLAGLVLAQAVDRVAGRRVHLQMSGLRMLVGTAMLLLFCLAGATRMTFYDQLDFQDSQAGKLLKLVKKYAEGKPVLIISPGIYPHFPVLNYANAKLAMRFQTIWPLQSAYEDCRPNDARYHSPDKMPAMERLFRRVVAEDFVKYKPPLVIMDKNPGIPWCGGREFDLMEYFLRVPAFAAEWKNYDFVYQFDRYVLFKRRPAGTTTPAGLPLAAQAN